MIAKGEISNIQFGESEFHISGKDSEFRPWKNSATTTINGSFSDKTFIAFLRASIRYFEITKKQDFLDILKGNTVLFCTNITDYLSVSPVPDAMFYSSGFWVTNPRFNRIRYGKQSVRSCFSLHKVMFNKSAMGKIRAYGQFSTRRPTEQDKERLIKCVTE